MKKGTVSAFIRKLKVVNDLIQKNYVDRFLKSTIISFVTECPTFVCFCFESNYEKFILIQPTQMLDPLLLMKLLTKNLKI